MNLVDLVVVASQLAIYGFGFSVSISASTAVLIYGVKALLSLAR